MSEIFTDYEKALLASLKELQSNGDWLYLADFTIICRNQEEIKTQKLLLAARSKYFQALFRMEPLKTSVELDYDGKIIQILLKSLVVSSNFNELDVNELLELLEVVDYLQMVDCMSETEKMLAEKFVNLENIYDILEFTEHFLQTMTILKDKCCIFVKENWLKIDLKKIAKTWINTIISSPSCHVKDSHGRFMDLLESEIKLAESLHHLDPDENNWNFSMESRRKIYVGLRDLSFVESLKSTVQFHDDHFISLDEQWNWAVRSHRGSDIDMSVDSVISLKYHNYENVKKKERYILHNKYCAKYYDQSFLEEIECKGHLQSWKGTSHYWINHPHPKNLRINLKNNAKRRMARFDLEGDYILANESVNGHHYWTKNDKAVWYDTNHFWIVGEIEDLGIARGSIYSPDSQASCPNSALIWNISWGNDWTASDDVEFISSDLGR